MFETFSFSKFSLAILALPNLAIANFGSWGTWLGEPGGKLGDPGEESAGGGGHGLTPVYYEKVITLLSKLS